MRGLLDYRSVPDGILLVTTILVWSLIMDWLSYRSAAVRWLVHPPAMPLVEDGGSRGLRTCPR